MEFSEDTIQNLRNHIIDYQKANSSEDRKKARQKMQKLGFRMTDFNLTNITLSDFEKLIASKRIKITINDPGEKVSLRKPQKVLPDDSELAGKVMDAQYIDISPERINQLNFIGLYSLRLKSNSTLPDPFQTILESRAHPIIYFGKAEGQNLKGRLEQELYARGHGTFYRSIGAVLGYLPEAGSLHGKANQNNYKFSKEDVKQISEWIETNLEIAIFKTENLVLEKELIGILKPLLNHTHNPLSLPELRMVKKNCRATARNKN